MRLEEDIAALVPGDGGHLLGFADLTGLLHERYRGLEHAVSIGKRLDGGIIDAISSGPTREYYELYRDTNLYLEGLAGRVAEKLEERGARALAVTPTMDEENDNPSYLETLRTTFSHKMAATRAGLGWIGKTDLLVTEEFGPRLRLVTVLTGQPLQPLHPPVDSSRCGDCEECVKACPARAANGQPWDIRTDRDEFYDAFACSRKARELSRRRIGRDTSICGICVSVCPRGVPGTPS